MIKKVRLVTALMGRKTPKNSVLLRNNEILVVIINPIGVQESRMSERKLYPRLPAEVVREHELMSDEEIRKLEENLLPAEGGGSLPVTGEMVSNPSPTPPTPCHSDSVKNKQDNNYTPPANSVPLEPLAPTTSQINKEIGKDYTLMLHYLAQRIRENMANGKLPTDEERSTLRLLDDLKRSYDYTQKFSEHIKQNPGMLIRPGSMGGPASQNLRTLESQLRKTSKQDKRKSSTPPRPSSGDGISLPA